MLRHMVIEHLALARRHVARGEELIARQNRLLAELARDRHDTVMAQALLRTLETTQRLYVEDCDRLARELAAMR